MGKHSLKNTGKTTVLAAAALLCAAALITPMSSKAQENSQFSAIESAKPVLVIRFNQKNVYFENALKTVVDSVARGKIDASYAVESVTPMNETQDGRADSVHAANLLAVVSKLNKLGVDANKIGVKESKSDAVTSQEISIFVQKN